MRYVLDASLAAKRFLPSAQESLSDEAEEMFRGLCCGQFRLLVPDLFWPEVGNILWKAVRMGRMTRPAADASIAALQGSGLNTMSSRPLLPNAFAIATTFGRTVYDATYVALAAESGAPFITADDRLVNAFSGRFPVRWLGAF